MAQLAELERAKRRRLQEAYADLRPSSKRDDKRQVKLRNLLLGAVADAGAAAQGSSRSDATAPNTPADVNNLAAAAAASIQAVRTTTTTPAGKAVSSRRAALQAASAASSHAATTAATTSASAATGSSPPFQRVTSAPIPRGHDDPNSHSHTLALMTSRGVGPHWGPGAGRGHRPPPPPPPGPMDGGFIQEVDPIQRLSQLHARGDAPAGPGGDGISGGGKGGAAGWSGGQAGLQAAGTAAAAVAGGMPYRHGAEDNDVNDVVLGAAELPSDIELALIALRSELQSQPGSSDLPPLALRSQLGCLLADRHSIDQQLDKQRRANRVRLFKLPTGADEFGVLTTSDYRAVILAAADSAAAAAAAAAADGRPHSGAQQRRAQSAPGAFVGSAAGGSGGAYGTWNAVGGGGGGGIGGRTGGALDGRSRWHVAAEAYLRRVVDRFTEFQLSHDHLVHLLTSPEVTSPSSPSSSLPRAATASAAAGAGALGRTTSAAASRPTTATAPARQGQGQQMSRTRATAPSTEEVEEQISLLLHLGCIARHTDGDADAFVMAVPGAGKLVKAVVGGRRELLTWLSKRQYREAPEKQICKLKLRSSCLPPLYHLHDLEGRGKVMRIEGTSGHMIRLVASGVGVGSRCGAGGAAAPSRRAGY